jgi:hypothetical protein
MQQVNGRDIEYKPDDRRTESAERCEVDVVLGKEK